MSLKRCALYVDDFDLMLKEGDHTVVGELPLGIKINPLSISIEEIQKHDVVQEYDALFSLSLFSGLPMNK